MRIGAAAVLLYAVAVLTTAWRIPDLGLFSYLGSPILAVDSGGPAETAGIRTGDVITAIDGRVLADRHAVARALDDIEPGGSVTIVVMREGRPHSAVLATPRRVPWSGIAGTLFAAIIILGSLLADRGGNRDGLPYFYWESLGVAVFLSGAFSWPVIWSSVVLSVPWLTGLIMSPVFSCQFMRTHPAPHGRAWRFTPFLIYGPAIGLAGVINVGHAYMAFGGDPPRPDLLFLAGGIAITIFNVVYVIAGGVTRARHVRLRHSEMTTGAARLLYASSACAIVAPIGMLIWVAADPHGFITGGKFRIPGTIGALSATMSVLLSTVGFPLGELDRILRRQSGYLLATVLSAGLFMLVVSAGGVLGSLLSGGRFSASLGAALIAAVLFGPIRQRIQRAVDARFARDRTRARSLLREAAEEAVAILDLGELCFRVAIRVRQGLLAEGVAVYGRVASPDGPFWRRLAGDGTVSIGAELARRDPIAVRLDQIADLPAGRGAHLLCADVCAVPVLVDRHAHALVVSPGLGGELGDEDLDLLRTLAAQLAVAMRNAHAYESLGLMRDEAERRRKEIARLKDRVEAENRDLARLLATREADGVVIGPGMSRTFELVQRVAHADSTVLLTGETGAGKDLIARALHAASARRDGPFMVVDCGSLSPGLIESALFGHERGSFTGAVCDTPGAFRAADGGTIFLDELGELPLELQPKLLRVLERREVQPVGATRTIPINVRVIAGTHRDLAAMTAEGTFREDLWYRLRVIEIPVPPLRDRKTDVLPLAEHFLDGVARRSGQPHKKLSASARVALVEHDWPGNVRELANVIAAATVYCDGDEILASDLPVSPEILRSRGRERLRAQQRRPDARGSMVDVLDGLERERVLEVLREQGGNKTRAARALGISRSALQRRLERYGVDSGGS
jgi:transcriptional regulator with GAF, ATPase, and Fis domain